MGVGVSNRSTEGSRFRASGQKLYAVLGFCMFRDVPFFRGRGEVGFFIPGDPGVESNNAAGTVPSSTM